MHLPRLGLLLIALPLLTGCGRHPAHSTATPAAQPPAKVRVATARLENTAALIDVSGTVRPVQRAQIAAKITGTIEELPVVLGQRVRAGELLVKLSAAEMAARAAVAQSQLKAAQRELERERALLPQGASTAEAVRSLEDRFAAAQATVREAETMLGYAEIRAPFAGIVFRRPANAGDLASPGAVLLELEGNAGFQVEVAVPDSLAGAVTVGSAQHVEIPSRGVVFSSTVAELSSAFDPGARSVLAKLAVPAGVEVRSGEFVRVRLPAGGARALFVPAAAVSPLGQMERAFVVGDRSHAVLRIVKTGASRGDQIEITAGLDAGERVVVAPPLGLREGQPLEALP